MKWNTLLGAHQRVAFVTQIKFALNQLIRKRAAHVRELDADCSRRNAHEIIIRGLCCAVVKVKGTRFKLKF